jgi:glycosyltransferase involved in cell wall biosynthesis
MLSVIIITKNESHHIRRCLESIIWADEIIIFDSGSTDDTVSICQRYTEKVFVTDWPGFGPQKQRALNCATQPWVLSIHADETVSPALKQEIEIAIKNTEIQGYEIPRLSSYCGKDIQYGGWRPDYVLRLFQRKAGQFSNDLVHEQVKIKGTTKRLQSPLLHEAFVNPEEVLQKMNNYSSLGAQQLFKKGKKASLTLALLKGLWRFIKTYFIKLSILNGEEGLMLAISNAEGTYYKYIKLRQLSKND